jgi:hypothetical protein
LIPRGPCSPLPGYLDLGTVGNTVGVGERAAKKMNVSVLKASCSMHLDFRARELDFPGGGVAPQFTEAGCNPTPVSLGEITLTLSAWSFGIYISDVLRIVFADRSFPPGRSKPSRVSTFGIFCDDQCAANEKNPANERLNLRGKRYIHTSYDLRLLEQVLYTRIL